MKIKVKYLAGICISVMLLLSLACSDDAQSVTAPVATAAPAATAAPKTITKTDQPRKGGVINLAEFITIKNTLNPHLAADARLMEAYYVIFNNLVQLDSNGQLQPDLAESWDMSGDGKTIVFNLVKGAQFTDGTHFTAEAAKWNIEDVLNPDTHSPYRKELEPFVGSVEAPDTYTLVITLKKAYRPFVVSLSERAGAMLSPTAVLNSGEDFGARPVGSGPYMFKNWVPGNKLSMVRNDNYWESGKPYMDGINLHYIDQEDVRIAMVRTGEVDLISRVTPTYLPILEQNPDLKLIRKPGAWEGLALNTSIAPFDNKALREAIAYSLNRQEIVDLQWAGLGSPIYQPVIPIDWAYVEGIDDYKHDLTKAKAKLAEAGYSAGVTIPLGCHSSTANIRLCEIEQAQLAKAGIKVEINPIPPSDYWATLYPSYPGKKTAFGKWRYSWRADPEIVLRRLYHSAGSWNAVAHKNPEMDKLLDEGVVIYDIAEAKKVYEKIIRLAVSSVSHVALATTDMNIAMNNRVQNFKQHADPGQRYREVWLSK